MGRLHSGLQHSKAFHSLLDHILERNWARSCLRAPTGCWHDHLIQGQAPDKANTVVMMDQGLSFINIRKHTHTHTHTHTQSHTYTCVCTCTNMSTQTRTHLILTQNPTSTDLAAQKRALLLLYRMLLVRYWDLPRDNFTSASHTPDHAGQTAP